MWEALFQNIIAPITVGVVLALFSWWLDRKDDD
ncbi:TPA: type I toxin-antitoxin system Fst family toxin [Streptococcus equi subsp. zooepidemicus]|nr:type I toxin-antitoxin system Fst family toxin [Streptococcus equi subsp. zooepidemicus]